MDADTYMPIAAAALLGSMVIGFLAIVAQFMFLMRMGR